jgi:hypothetical protein
MAKQSRTDELFEMLRARGLRTRVARILSDAASAGRTGASASQSTAQGIVDDLRKLADEIEGRITGKGSSRSDAAKKAARTRASNATKRSAAAKKGAATRKKAASTSPRKAASGTRKAASKATSKATGTARKATGTARKSSASGGTRRRTSSSSRAKKS